MSTSSNAPPSLFLNWRAVCVGPRPSTLRALKASMLCVVGLAALTSVGIGVARSLSFESSTRTVEHPLQASTGPAASLTETQYALYTMVKRSPSLMVAGESPLMQAVRTQEWSYAHALLEAGSDPWQQNRQGGRPLDLLVAQWHVAPPSVEALAVLEHMKSALWGLGYDLMTLHLPDGTLVKDVSRESHGTPPTLSSTLPRRTRP